MAKVARPGCLFFAASTSSGGGVMPVNTSTLLKWRGRYIQGADCEGSLLKIPVDDLPGLPHATPSLISSSYLRVRLQLVNDGATVLGRGLVLHKSSGSISSLPTSSLGDEVRGMLTLGLDATTQWFTLRLKML